MTFSADFDSGAEECFAISSGKNGFRLFLKAKACGGIAAFFICAVVAYKITVCDLLSAFAGNGYPVRNKIMSVSVLFASAVFIFHRRNLRNKLKVESVKLKVDNMGRDGLGVPPPSDEVISLPLGEGGKTEGFDG